MLRDITYQGDQLSSGAMRYRSRLRAIALGCVLAAVACLGYGVWLLVPHVRLQMQTKAIEATVVRSDLIKEHDSRGYLLYGLSATFLYELAGKSSVNVAKSLDQTYAWAAEKKEQDTYSPKSRHLIRYETAKPEQIYLDGGLTWVHWKPSLLAALGALLFLTMGWFLRSLARAPRGCASCRGELEDYFKFCPFCGATIQAK